MGKAIKASNPSKPIKPSSYSSSHPPYSKMIGDAIVALKERTGSSQYAISKFIEEKHKANLPANFKRTLLSQLKRLVAAGKIIKIKHSFKISASAAAIKPKPAAATKPKPVAPARPKKRLTKASPGKKVTAVKPVKVKKPKSVKSPAKAVKKAAKAAKKG